MDIGHCSSVFAYHTHSGKMTMLCSTSSFMYSLYVMLPMTFTVTLLCNGPAIFCIKKVKFYFDQMQRCLYVWTHTPFNSHFPDEPGLSGCPVDSQSPVICILSILLVQAKILLMLVK